MIFFEGCKTDSWLADFATAVQVSKGNTSRNDDAGVIYWQAPEIRRFVLSLPL